MLHILYSLSWLKFKHSYPGNLLDVERDGDGADTSPVTDPRIRPLGIVGFPM